MESEAGAPSYGIKTIQLNDGKAGMQGLDKESINKVIYEASVGTPYFLFQEKRQKTIDFRVNEMMESLKKVSNIERKAAKEKMDALGASLDARRDLSHSIVHVDMDAFYAAVEMKDNPHLVGKPVAVGTSSMLSTSNYEARKYGVRAAMPGFIAKKLCPQLIIVPCHFSRYREVSNQVCDVVRHYDPDFDSVSLDEMYLDLTEYLHRIHTRNLHQNVCLNTSVNEDYGTESELGCQCFFPPTDEERDALAEEVVAEIREKICSVTGLTASAGIAPNVMLAKVCSDQNKPNGQYQIKSKADSVQAFTSSLLVKKVSGIGPVQSQILNAMGIHTCSDMWEKRDTVPCLFKPSTAEFYIHVSKGIGSTKVKSEYVRKSIGVEQTFTEMNERPELLKKCQELCEEAVHDMKMKNMVGKVVVLKFKTTNFKSHTRNHTLPCFTADQEIISKAAARLLDVEILLVAPQPLRLRLMGIRIANLVYEDTIPSIERHLIKIKDFLKPRHSAKSEKCPSNSTATPQYTENQASVLNCNSEHQVQLNSNDPNTSLPLNDEDSVSNNFNDPVNSTDPCDKNFVRFTCPVCSFEQNCKSLADFNSHIDSCLNKAAIKQMLSEEQPTAKRKPQWKVEQYSKKSKVTNKSDRRIEDYFHSPSLM